MLNTYISSCEVTTLEHEIRDNAMELGSNIPFALLCGRAKLLKVFCCFGDNIVEKLEVNAASLF